MPSLPSGSSTTTGRRLTPSVDRIATCGWLMIGSVISVPYGPGFVIVNVPPTMSSGLSFLPRLAAQIADLVRDRPHPLGLGVVDDRHHQALEVEVDGDAEVDVVVHDQLVLAERRVHFGVVADGVDDRARDEREIREAEAFLRLPRVALGAPHTFDGLRSRPRWRRTRAPTSASTGSCARRCACGCSRTGSSVSRSPRARDRLGLARSRAGGAGRRPGGGGRWRSLRRGLDERLHVVAGDAPTGAGALDLRTGRARARRSAGARRATAACRRRPPSASAGAGAAFRGPRPPGGRPCRAPQAPARFGFGSAALGGLGLRRLGLGRRLVRRAASAGSAPGSAGASLVGAPPTGGPSEITASTAPTSTVSPSGTRISAR